MTESLPPLPPLVDAEERAVRYPGTFRIPARAERERLRVGQTVKLIFGDRERLWVEVMAVLEGGRYRGALRNVSLVWTQLDYGTAVEFGPEHVCDIED